MGIWKFADRVSKKDLFEIAEKWKDEDPNYLQLYVRKVSKDQNGIGFCYRLPEGEDKQKAYDEYLDKTTDYLKRIHGNDFVGWDISMDVRVIKDEKLS